jgi:hypothetical protein
MGFIVRPFRIYSNLNSSLHGQLYRDKMYKRQKVFADKPYLPTYVLADKMYRDKNYWRTEHIGGQNVAG